jgi:hypothetical protein
MPPTETDLLTEGLNSGEETAILTQGLDSGAGSDGETEGGTNEVVVLVRGPLRLRSNGRISEEGYVSDTLPLLLWFEDDTGRQMSLDGATLSYQLTQYGSVVTDTTAVDPTLIYSQVQMFRVNCPLPATQGIARLSVTRAAGSNDVQTAEILINVRPK